MSGYPNDVNQAQLLLQWEIAEREAKLRRENRKLIIALGMMGIAGSITGGALLSGWVCQ